MGADGLTLVTGASGAKYMSLAPESRMAVVEIWAVLSRGGAAGAARHLYGLLLEERERNGEVVGGWGDV
jgi:hypothetical protein